MAKKNPNSPEWIARCVDAAAAFTDGSKMTGENMYKPVWDLYITIPRFFGMGEENAKEWNKNIRNMLNSIGRPLLDSSPTKYGRVQYHIIGQGSFKSFEDTILKLYDTPEMDDITGGAGAVWKQMLETNRPTQNIDIDITGKLDEINKVIFEKQQIGGLTPQTIDIWSNIGNLDIENSALYPILKTIAKDTNSDELRELCIEVTTKISEYRNNIRMQEENWLAKALAPLASPFEILAIKTDKDGNFPEFNSRAEYSDALMKRMFSDDAGKIRAQLENVSVLSTKVFPISAFRTSAVEPKAYVNNNEVTVSLSWLHQRFNWPLTNNLINVLEKQYNAVINDSRKSGKVKFPDPFGLETLNTQRAVITTSSPQEAKGIAESITKILKVFYSPDKHVVLNDKEKSIIEHLAAESDLIAKRLRDMKAEKEAKSTSLVIEDRIMPYPAKCAVYVQIADGKMTSDIQQAVDKTLEKYPEWRMGNVFAAKDYTSFHINSDRTKEAAGFAERYAVAAYLSENLKKATGKEFPVEYPTNKLNIEVSVRKMNAQDKTDDTAGIYIKIPLAMVQGGKLEEEVINDPDIVENFDPVSRGLYELSESFGKNSGSKNMFRQFVQKNAQLEAYTNTWAYKFKDTDDHEAKLAEFKQILEDKVQELFGENTDNINIDWLPDRDARKLKEYNRQIQSFSKNWGDLLDGRKQQYAVETEMSL